MKKTSPQLKSHSSKATLGLSGAAVVLFFSEFWYHLPGRITSVQMAWTEWCMEESCPFKNNG